MIIVAGFSLGNKLANKPGKVEFQIRRGIVCSPEGQRDAGEERGCRGPRTEHGTGLGWFSVNTGQGKNKQEEVRHKETIPTCIKVTSGYLFIYLCSLSHIMDFVGTINLRFYFGLRQ